ncbi:CLUMA_CG007702, isoform A [Clunio marinus]|uniref:CLUMA_CG007702, isoform A n=1 Tax=Clunio marinus TaxID=568069 RepID=A0A1J1I332_9DIPT|nr:CLUMA_CG007702, isoform A [Clunio marinus]
MLRGFSLNSYGNVYGLGHENLKIISELKQVPRLTCANFTTFGKHIKEEFQLFKTQLQSESSALSLNSATEVQAIALMIVALSSNSSGIQNADKD